MTTLEAAHRLAQETREIAEVFRQTADEEERRRKYDRMQAIFEGEWGWNFTGDRQAGKWRAWTEIPRGGRTVERPQPPRPTRRRRIERLERLIAPGSGATDGERRAAQHHLSRLKRRSGQE